MEWTIKQTAERTGIPVHTLRYYDKEGLVSPKRCENGYRKYTENDISNLKNIIVMKYAHFSLAEMKMMEDTFHLGSCGDCNEISKKILNSKIVELRQTVCNFQKIITLIEKLLSMIDSMDSYLANEDRIDAFINQIFDSIQNDRQLPLFVNSSPERKEV